MFLNTVKWLSWLIAVALVALPFLAMVLNGSIGLVELIVTFFVAGIISLPGWLIHSAQKQKKPNTV